MSKCPNCERLQAQLSILDAALMLASEVNEALKPLIPNPETLSPEQKVLWQRLIDAIFRGAEFCDGVQLPQRMNAGWIEVRRGFGKIDLKTLDAGEFVTASGLRDGGYIVWKHKKTPAAVNQA